MDQSLKIFLLIALGLVATACASTNAPDQSEMLMGTWRVEDIDQRGVIDYAQTTLTVAPDYRISGSTGCNQYSGSLDTKDNTFVVTEAASTLRACVPAVMNQEQLFMAALTESVRYEIAEGIWLVIFDAQDRPRLKLIQVGP